MIIFKPLESIYPKEVLSGVKQFLVRELDAAARENGRNDARAAKETEETPLSGPLESTHRDALAKVRFAYD